MNAPRIGIAGFFLEANRWAPVTDAAAFAAGLDVAGAALGEELRAAVPRLLPDTWGFARTMDAAGPWTPVPLRVALAYPGGPVDPAWFDAFLADLAQRLRQAGPLDGVYLCSHGAALASDDDDADARFYECVRAAVGPRVPVVAVLDLHANVSRRMTDALSGLCAYRTNPHVDLRERGEQAAQMLRAMLAEGPGEVALAKLPFVPASTDQLIAPGTPYHALMQQAQAAAQAEAADVLDASLCGGFALADSTNAGVSVLVTSRHGRGAAAQRLARQLAAAVWARRQDFATPLTPLDEAIAQAVACGRDDASPRLILADVADNPGGGGRGNTTALLQALLLAGAQRALLGVFCDPALAAQAHALGVGAAFEAVFNRRQPGDPLDECRAPGASVFSHPARVRALSDGAFVGRKGLVRGSARSMGPSALLDLGGVQVAVISSRQQLLDPAQLDVLGVELAGVRTLVVKSRGHFRAAFDDFAPADRIVEVDGPGLTTPRLARLPLQRTPRPVWPLDPEACWHPV